MHKMLPRIAIVRSLFNLDISNQLLASCLSILKKEGFDMQNLWQSEVSGALEVPLIVKHLALSGKFDVLVALGAVIRGDTYHFEIVANESARGLMTVQLDSGIPVVNGILTCDTDEQALARISKGGDAAMTALEIHRVLSSIPPYE